MHKNNVPAAGCVMGQEAHTRDAPKGPIALIREAATAASTREPETTRPRKIARHPIQVLLNQPHKIYRSTNTRTFGRVGDLG
jgi:hypothetical protein